METLKLKLVFDRRKEVNTPNTQGSIEIYVYDSVSRKNIYIPTGIKVLASQFKQGKGERGSIIKHPNTISINGKLDRIYREVEAFSLSDKCKELNDVKSWNVKIENTESVITFMQSELKRKNPAYQTMVQHNTLIKRLEQFGQIKTFSDFTYQNVVDFDAFLKSNGDDREALGDATANKRHSMLNSYIREAINRGYCSYNPYGTFRPKKGKAKDPVFLTQEELEAIRDHDLKDVVDGDRIKKVRDLFIFQCYTGLAYVDLKDFNGKEDISEIDGQKVIRSNRQKTEQGYITVLLPDAIEVLEKYDYKLPVISNQKYNDYLKLLALYVVDKEKKPIITKRLTTHVARHTCGTYLINKGVPIETVSRMLGHSNTKMTRHYAKLLGKKVVSDVLTYVINPQKEEKLDK